jgi:peptide-methionine (S)-S-oxide reductase
MIRNEQSTSATERAVLAGGCFWGVQDLIRKLPGIESTRVGCTGGDVKNATYRHHGTHAEGIEIIFDPNKISYRRILEFFFQIHDPTTPNRQGNDRGASYRSAIYFTSESQRLEALNTIADVNASGLWPGKVVTELAPAADFWVAEPEHQDYLERYPDGYTCHFPRSNWVLSGRRPDSLSNPHNEWASNTRAAMNPRPCSPLSNRPGLGKILMLLATGALVLAALYLGPQAAAEKTVTLPAAAAQVTAGLAASTQTQETVVFAGGCFWGVQAVFQHTKGVLNAVSGYAGGKAADANYDTVSRGATGHAESVQVTFDPNQVSYVQLLQIYFAVAHDPTQLNQQFPDTGPQYRSAVFTTTAAQQQITERYIAQLESAHIFHSKIVTQLAALQGFYPAEKYHQNYATLHPDAPYIARYDLPKVANLKSTMPALFREQAVLVAR